jgi:hypothetical protein
MPGRTGGPFCASAEPSHGLCSGARRGATAASRHFSVPVSPSHLRRVSKEGVPAKAGVAARCLTAASHKPQYGLPTAHTRRQHQTSPDLTYKPPAGKLTNDRRYDKT